MKRNHLIALILTSSVFSTTCVGLWSLQAFIASRPVNQSAPSVKSASTNSEDILAAYPSLSQNTRLPVINARRFILLHKESGKVLLSRETNQAVPIASTTKLMTARIVLREANLDDIVTVPVDAIVNGSSMGLKNQEEISVDNLLYGLMLVSGNDAANTLAYHVGQKLLNNPTASFAEARERFIAEMNQEATKLNLTETHYLDPAGLNDDGQSSALDLAKLMIAEIDNPKLQKLATTAEYTATNVNGGIIHQLKNSNRLVTEVGYSGILVGKTGFTPAAGHCLVTSAERGGVTYIAVILSTYDDTVTASAQEARKLLDWAFANVTVQPLTVSTQAGQPAPPQSGPLVY